MSKYPEVDFVQLQINYSDWDNPGVASRRCWEICREHGKPVTVMEPVKGGALANKPWDGGKRGYTIATAQKGKASECIQCGQCEAACPQHLPVISLLEECGKAME